MKFWLMKSEPDSYSIDDLARDKQTSWNGVRNYQARNFMRAMQKGDRVLFYHSGANPPCIAGIAEVVKVAHPDTTALDPKHVGYDPKSTKEKPIWEMVDIGFVKKFGNPISISAIKKNPKLLGIMVAERGSRLSVQPVSKAHFEILEKMGNLPYTGNHE